MAEANELQPGQPADNGAQHMSLSEKTQSAVSTTQADLLRRLDLANAFKADASHPDHYDEANYLACKDQASWLQRGVNFEQYACG